MAEGAARVPWPASVSTARQMCRAETEPISAYGVRRRRANGSAVGDQCRDRRELGRRPEEAPEARVGFEGAIWPEAMARKQASQRQSLYSLCNRSNASGRSSTASHQHAPCLHRKVAPQDSQVLCFGLGIMLLPVGFEARHPGSNGFPSPTARRHAVPAAFETVAR